MSMDNPFVSAWCPCNISHFHPFSHEQLGFPGANWDILRLCQGFRHPYPAPSSQGWTCDRRKRWPILRVRTLAWGPCISDFPVLAVFYCKTRSSSLFDSGSEEIPYIYIYWWYRIQWHPMTFSVWNLLESLKQVLSYGPQFFFGQGFTKDLPYQLACILVQQIIDISEFPKHVATLLCWSMASTSYQHEALDV